MNYLSKATFLKKYPKDKYLDKFIFEMCGYTSKTTNIFGLYSKKVSKIIFSSKAVLYDDGINFLPFELRERDLISENILCVSQRLRYNNDAYIHEYWNICGDSVIIYLDKVPLDINNG